MTVTSTTSTASFVGDGVATAFPTGIRFLDAAHLVVELDGVPLSECSDFTVAGARGDAGGAVKLLVPPELGAELRVARTMPLVQETSFRTQGSFAPRLHEDAFDALTMQVQQKVRDGSHDDAGLDARLSEIEAGVITTEQATGAPVSGPSPDHVAWSRASWPGACSAMPAGARALHRGS